MKNGRLLVISGPSAGVGKDTILKMFLRRHPDWHRLTTVITRSPRPGEVNGIDYWFVSREQFKQWQTENRFLETDFHANNWYGTLRQSVEEALEKAENSVLRTDVNGSLSIKRVIPEAILIYIDTKKPEHLETRIRDRAKTSGETEAQIQSRLNLAYRETRLKSFFDHIVVNPQGHPEQAVAEIEKIIDT